MHRIVSILLTLGVLATVVGVPSVASDASALIDQAEALYAERYAEDVLHQMISLYEGTLPDLEALPTQTQAFVLNRLAQLCYEVATLSPGEAREKRELYEQGKAYGLQSLRLNPQFAETERRDFGRAVSYVTDAAALLWTADNWGILLGLNPFTGMSQQGEVRALFSRSVEVDPDFFGGSASSALGSLLIMSPGILGGNDEAGLALVYDAIERHPTYLSHQVVLAEYWGFTYNYFGKLRGVRDRALIEESLNAVLEAEIGDWPFWNRNAKEHAAELLEQLHDVID